MTTIDKNMAELMELLKIHPELMSALAFDPVSVKRLLKSKGARRLALGVDVKAFLREVIAPKNGGPFAMCMKHSRALCTLGSLCMKLSKPPGRIANR
jgi:hypothetical protein